MIALRQPPLIACGPGSLQTGAEWVDSAGCRRVFLITSPETHPLSEPLAAALGDRVAGRYDGIRGEPDIAAFEKALTAARKAQPDAVMGVGGGSVLDVAKLVAALVDSSGETVREVFGIGLLAGRRVKLACVPTTSGTGSEVSPNAILLDESDLLKKGVISPWLVPDAAFVDAELTVSMPPEVTAFTGLDALTHCIEAYTNIHAHPAVDLYALEGVRLIAANLERAYRDGSDLEARDAMARGSLYGGLCLGPVNTAAVHALAYPLGGEFHVPHGLSNAVLLPAVMRFNAEAAPERYTKLAQALGARTADEGIERVEALCRAVGARRPLASLGVPEDAIPRIAAAALTVQRLLKNNPRPVTLDDAKAIYGSIYA